MKRPKILYILHAVGGVEVWLRLILKNLDPAGFEIVVLHGKNDTDRPFMDKDGNPVREITTTIDRAIHPLKDANAIFRAISIVKKERPALIHAHSAKAGMIGKIVGAATGVPVLYTPHAYSYLSASSSLKKKLFLGLERFFKKFNNKVLAISNSERERALKDVHYPSHKVLVYNNAVNPIREVDELSIKKTWPFPYICSVGRPSYQKNIELMIDVLAQLKAQNAAIHLVLMGVGFHAPNLENVKRKIQLLNLQKNVTLLDWTQRQDIFSIIADAQLYISTARYEGLPYSVIEALALGKACVVTDADGNRDLVEDGVNGYVVRNEDATVFAQKITELLDNDEQRQNFEKASLHKFNQQFNIEKTIHQLEAIYQNEAS